MRQIIESGILPPSALQLICGGTGDLLDHLSGQDVLSFTGSLETSEKLRNHPAVSRNAVRFVAERDSLNAAILAAQAGEYGKGFSVVAADLQGPHRAFPINGAGA